MNSLTKKKLLLTHCGHSEVPLIIAAKNLGWYVIAVSDNLNNVGHSFADQNFCGEFFDGEFIYNLARDLKVDAIVSGCEDSAYLSAAYACDKLGLPGHDCYEVAKIVHNKMLFREVMRELKLPTPIFEICTSIENLDVIGEKVGFPLIVKPVDLNSGIGCAICRSREELETSFTKARNVSKSDEIIIEQYIQGTNHATNVFFQNQKVIHSFFDNEQYYINPYLVSGASSPSNLLHHTMEQVHFQLEKIAGKLKLVDGMFHVQFIVDSQGTPYLIDPCRRIPGGLYILFSRYASGFNVAENVVRFETGDRSANFDDVFDRKVVAREYIMTNRSGVIKKIFIDDAVKERIFDKFIWAKEGDTVKDPLTYKAGLLFMEFNNFCEMNEVIKNFYDHVHIEFK